MVMASIDVKIRHVFGDTPITEASIGAAPPGNSIAQWLQFKKVSAKTWRFVTRFTSQSSYFYGEHHWPNSTNVEKPIINPPYFINLLSVLKVEINFYSIRFGNIVALLAQVRICIILFLLTILFYMCIPCFGLL